jgi:hypothetical protein
MSFFEKGAPTPWRKGLESCVQAAIDREVNDAEMIDILDKFFESQMIAALAVWERGQLELPDEARSIIADKLMEAAIALHC